MRIGEIDGAIVSIGEDIDNNLLDFAVLTKIGLRSKFIPS